MKFLRNIVGLPGLRPLARTIAAMTFVAAAVQAQADYRLHAGDVVELSVAGTPQLALRASLQMDGTLTFPMVGTLMAGDETILTVREHIQTVLASKVLRLHTADGREYLRAVEREDVAVSVVEYRPVVVDGQVTNPGEVTFRPHMTVRHALASAGGVLKAAPLANGVAISDIAELRSAYVAAWTALAAQHVRVWRIDGELTADDKPYDASEIPASPSSEPNIEMLLALEAAYRETEREEVQREKQHLTASISQTDDHIAALMEQQKTEEQGVAADTEELSRSDQLLSQGTVVHARVSDARRSLLMSSTRLLQTRSQLMQVRRARLELTNRLQRIDAERRLDLLRQKQEAIVKLATERERLSTIAHKLRLAGVAEPQQDMAAWEPLIKVFRQGKTGKTVGLIAGLDSELEPGDIIQVDIDTSGAEQISQAGRP